MKSLDFPELRGAELGPAAHRCDFPLNMYTPLVGLALPSTTRILREGMGRMGYILRGSAAASPADCEGEDCSR
jgi:hypothetical protein